MTRSYQYQDAKCAVTLCNLPAKVKGWCASHYGRKWHHGLTDEEAVLMSPARIKGPHGKPKMRCTGDGCESEATKTGLCDNCYSRKRYQTVTRPVSLVRVEDRQNRRSAYVYLFQAAPGWSPGGVRKIGRGTTGRLSPNRQGGDTSRLHGLLCASPGGQFVRQVDTEHADEMERWLHRRFKAQHVAGEWFRITPEEFDAAVLDFQP